MKKYEVHRLIEAFINGAPDLDPWAWDNFTSCRQKSPEIEAIRHEILDIDARNPADKKGYWCSEKGIAELQALADRLREELAQEKFIGVICGLKSEAQAVAHAVGKSRIRIGVSGANAARAEEIAREFCNDGASAIISVGVSGGLDPALMPGDLVIGDTIHGDEVQACDPYLLSVIKSVMPHGALIAPLFGADEIVDSARKKAAFYQNHGAVAVDMESHGAARAAARAGAPFIAIRAIADPADRALPQAALNAVAPDGSTRVMATLAAALRDPKQFPELLKLGADSNAALKTLRRDLGPILGGLFLSLDL